MRLGFGKQGILLGLRNVGAVQAGTGQTFEDDRQFLLPAWFISRYAPSSVSMPDADGVHREFVL